MTITLLLQSMCGSGILWCLTCTWSCECLLHLAYVLAMVVLDRHLVVRVGYMFVCAVLVFSTCCTVAICEVGCLACT